MTNTATPEAQPMTRRERREAERRAAETAASTAVAEAPVYMTRRERRLAEQAALAAQAAAAVTKAELAAEAALAEQARAGIEKFTAAAAASVVPQAIEEQVIPAAFATEAFAPAETAVRLGSTRAVRPVQPQRGRARSVAGALAVGIAASAGVAAWLPSATGAANASSDHILEVAPGSGQTLSVSASQQAQQVSRTDSVSVATMGTATAANLLGGTMKTDPTTFSNDLTAPVQFPFPTGTPLTDRYGYRTHPILGTTAMHWGVDFTPGEGTPIGAIAEGRVTQVFPTDADGLGVHVVLEHQIDGETVYSLYAHMIPGSLTLKVGDVVNVGDQVGLVGNTGWSTGAHLHLEIYQGKMDNKVDPLAYLQSKNVPTTVVTPVGASVTA